MTSERLPDACDIRAVARRGAARSATSLQRAWALLPVPLEPGQVFIVTLVARLVILWVRQSEDESAPAAARSNERG